MDGSKAKWNFLLKEENFDEAKRLKQAMSELYKIGERLARYEIEKRQAIEEEDYERAKQKKEQIQEYRTETYKQLQQNNLLDFVDVRGLRWASILFFSKLYLNKRSENINYFFVLHKIAWVERKPTEKSHSFKFSWFDKWLFSCRP